MLGNKIHEMLHIIRKDNLDFAYGLVQPGMPSTLYTLGVADSLDYDILLVHCIVSLPKFE